MVKDADGWIYLYRWWSRQVAAVSQVLLSLLDPSNNNNNNLHLPNHPNHPTFPTWTISLVHQQPAARLEINLQYPNCRVQTSFSAQPLATRHPLPPPLHLLLSNHPLHPNNSNNSNNLLNQLMMTSNHPSYHYTANHPQLLHQPWL